MIDADGNAVDGPPHARAAVRRVRADDGDRVRSVRLAALADAPAAFASTHTAESQLTGEEWAARAERGASGSTMAWFVAIDDGRPETPVGTVGGLRHPGDPTIVDLISMWVHPDHRGTGLAARLVRAVLDWAAAVGVERVELWVVRDNEPAQRSYARMGFRATAATQTLASDPCRDELRMVRWLR